MQSLQNYIMRKMDTQNKKKPGYLLLQAILAMTAFTMMSYGLVLAFSSSFNMYGASKVALEAQQYAEIEANTLKMLGYDKLDTAGHSRATLSYADDWEGQVTIGDEQVIDADNDNKMRIASVDIFKKGDTTSRYTLNVPLTSQGGSGDSMPIGTILPYVGNLADIPTGWHLCDGTDGTPNLLDNRFLEGAADIGIFRDPGLPNITGSTPVNYFTASANTTGVYIDGAILTKFVAYGHWTGSSNYSSYMTFDFDASRSNPLYGASETVQPRSYTVMYIIKIK